MPVPKKTEIRPVVLIVCDGFGSAPAGLQGNAVLLANTPNLLSLWEHYPHAELFAHGTHVGLPEGQPGNSEAGHMNLGAGRVVDQDAVYVSKSIEDGTFFKNTAFLEVIKHVKKYGTALHLMGMVSNGNSAHASMDHVFGLLELARRHQIKDVFLHLFTDGRDGPRFGAPAQIHEIESRMRAGERIATVMGRFYAMDRNKIWSRVEMAFRAIACGEGLAAKDAETAVLQAYNRGETDEYIIPTVIVDKERRPIGVAGDNDGIIFFNLRSDRARELTKAFVMPDFEKIPGAFKRPCFPENSRFAAMTDFGPDLPHVLTAFPGRDLKNALPEALSGLKQLYIAESEKFSHVTYFFNGGYADARFGEERVRIDSLPIPRYDVAPMMSTPRIVDRVVRSVEEGEYHFICANFANADMVGHTGNLAAAVSAVEEVDEAIGRVWEAVRKKGGTLVVTADHGNVEEMIDVATGAPMPEHTTNPVPFIIASKDLKGYRELPRGSLADVAPTILDAMGLRKPEEMTGRSLLGE